MKIEICIKIILILLRYHQITAKDLAARFCVSTKTIYRYLSYLDMCDIPIATKKGKNGGIYLLNTFSIDKVFFTEKEKCILSDKINTIYSDDIKQSLKEKLGLI